MPNSNLTIDDALPLGIAVLDRSLKIISWNATLGRWSGVSAKEAVGRLLNELFPSVPVTTLQQRLLPVFENGQSVIFSPSMHRRLLPLKTSSGEPLLHKAHFSPAPQGEGQTLLVLEDVTANYRQLDKLRAERRRLKESEASLKLERSKLVRKNEAVVEARRKAEEANKAKSAFLASMSHEIRTPITAISGFAEILFERLTDADNKEAASTIVRNSYHLTNLVNDILDLARIEAGKMVLSSEPCNPVEIAKQAVKLQSARANAKGIDLALELGSGIPTMIQSDPLRLRQAMFNLVGNAVKFTEEGSIAVKMEADQDNRELKFTIIDTGIGIKEANLEAIFDPFAQEDGSMQRKFGGTGLGLSISRHLVEELGGKLTARSTLGVGSEFQIKLPVVLSDETETAPVLIVNPTSEPKLDQPVKPLAELKILVAEDGLDNQKLIRYLLERAGAEVTMVENGKLAFDLLTNQEETLHADLLLLDMQMPIMDGYTTAARLRSAGRTIPIIALTAHAMEGDREKAIQSGCNDYATKPIHVETLIDTIRQNVANFALQATAQ